MASGTLQRLDSHPIHDTPGEIRTFLTVRTEALFCLLLDMYAGRPVSEAVHIPAAALVDTCRYFDPGDWRAT